MLQVNHIIQELGDFSSITEMRY